MELTIQEVENTFAVNKVTANTILNAFAPFAQQFGEYRDEAFAITVESVSDVEGMKKAREMRLKLKKIRTSLEEKRVEIKQNALNTANAIDGLSKFIKCSIAEAEMHLDNQEKYAIKKEEERMEAIVKLRQAALSPYVDNIEAFNLGKISDEDFNIILENSKIAYEKRQEDARRAEAERIQIEENEKIRLKDIEKENAKLKAEADEKARLQKIEDEKKRKEHEKAMEAERVKQAKLQEKLDKERKENEAKQAKKDAEIAKAKADLAKAKKEEEDRLQAIEDKRIAEEKRIANASDAEKVKVFLNEISAIEFPKLSVKNHVLLSSVFSDFQNLKVRVTNCLNHFSSK